MSPKTSYKLTYFTLRWLGEPIRNLLSYVGAVYRFSKLPILEEFVKAEDGSKTKVAALSQSFTILKYLGKKYSLNGKDLLEEAKCDEIADCLKDILKELEELLTDDKVRRSKLRATLLTVTIPRYFSVFEKELKGKKNASGMMPLVGSKITWVDFLLATFSEEFETFFANKNYITETDADKARGDGKGLLLDSYPVIKKHQEWVNGLKGIKEWRGTRPVTEF